MGVRLTEESRLKFYIDTICLVLSSMAWITVDSIVHTLNGFIFVELSL